VAASGAVCGRFGAQELAPDLAVGRSDLLCPFFLGSVEDPVVRHSVRSDRSVDRIPRNAHKGACKDSGLRNNPGGVL
jgi:hypothetical protein